MTTRHDLVEQYKQGAAAVRAAVEGLDDAALDRRPGPEEWTAREVIHHLADAEMRSAVRLRQLVAEDDAVIQGYDEGLYAKRLHYERPVANALAAIDAARATSADLLDLLSEDEWARQGTHTESGPYSVMTWLEVYTAHAADHAEQIRRAAAG
jgi:hypothetical protein